MQHTTQSVPAPGRFSRRAAGFLFAGLLQAGLIWALVSGLDIKIIPQVISDPFKVTLDTQPKKPPEAPTQPLAEPEHVFVPVPPIEIIGGDSGDSHAITSSTTQPQPPVAGPRDHGPVSVAASHTIPPYPAMDARLGNQGTVYLRLLIGPDGSVQDVKIVRSSGSDSLDRAALGWVKAHWRYQPAVRGGVAVQGAVDVAVKFDLRNAG